MRKILFVVFFFFLWNRKLKWNHWICLILAFTSHSLHTCTIYQDYISILTSSIYYYSALRWICAQYVGAWHHTCIYALLLFLLCPSYYNQMSSAPSKTARMEANHELFKPFFSIFRVERISYHHVKDYVRLFVSPWCHFLHHYLRF